MPSTLDLTVADTASPAIAAALDALRDDLADVAGVLAGDLYAKARARAAGEVVAVRSGRYLEALATVVTASADAVSAEISDSDPMAAVLEYGATIPAHMILPTVASALRFVDGASAVYARHVLDPGATIAARHMLGGALDAEAPEIDAAMEAVARRFADRVSP